MALSKQEITAIILQGIEELNIQLPDGKKISASQETVIFGRDGGLDSMDFVNLIVIIEEKIFDSCGKSVTITSAKAFSKKYNPFANVDRLADFIIELLKEAE